MADIINLRQARKNKARVDKERKAESNRALFGRTKAEKHQHKHDTEKLQQHLDGHKLGAAPSPEDKA
ncbi:protein of unknown function [Cohaesibacter sp. ES.047]|uniref:DUF4169 family protein n=1 Tax=Cohaesibacter sp. ES.047 TaxID=1798205 RepID=UPI000BB948FA|nr:DUF4169 family protein [Cohaesibacter sp. ES.047]SNY94348.1 protein of unknown function [Cohaesibacter sp. ES.047]